MKKQLLAVASCILFMWLCFIPAAVGNPETGRFQKALTQADIDNYIKIWPVAKQGDAEALNAAYNQAGWNKEHGDYVLAKINTAFLVSTNPELKDALLDAMPAAIRPAEFEIRLVEENINALQTVYELPWKLRQN